MFIKKIYGDAFLYGIKSWVQTVKSQRNSLGIFLYGVTFKIFTKEKNIE